MEWWQILIAIIFISPIVVILFGGIICSIQENHNNLKKRKDWDLKHPNLTRIKCSNCKNCKKETNWAGRYPHGFPQRVAVYCKLLKIGVGDSSICQLAEPPMELCEPKNTIHSYPHDGTETYFSAYGDCYHSSTQCPSIKSSQHLHHKIGSPYDRRPCPKCWIEKDGVLYPKK